MARTVICGSLSVPQSDSKFSLDYSQNGYWTVSVRSQVVGNHGRPLAMPRIIEPYFVSSATLRGKGPSNLRFIRKDFKEEE